MARIKYPVITRKRVKFTVRWGCKRQYETVGSREEVMAYPVKLTRWLAGFVFKRNCKWYCCDLESGLTIGRGRTMADAMQKARSCALNLGRELDRYFIKRHAEWYDQHDRDMAAGQRIPIAYRGVAVVQGRINPNWQRVTCPMVGFNEVSQSRCGKCCYCKGIGIRVINCMNVNTALRICLSIYRRPVNQGNYYNSEWMTLNHGWMS